MLVCLAELRNEPLADNRGHLRRKLHLTLKASHNSSAHRVLIHDLSEAGMMIETAAPFAVGERFEIELPDAGSVSVLIKWNDGFRFGCEFEDLLSRGTVSAALLRAPFEVKVHQEAFAGAGAEELAPVAYEMPGREQTGKMATASLVALLSCAIAFASALAVAPFSMA